MKKQKNKGKKKALLTKGMLALFDHKTLPRFDDNSPAAIRPGRTKLLKQKKRRVPNAQLLVFLLSTDLDYVSVPKQKGKFRLL